MKFSFTRSKFKKAPGPWPRPYGVIFNNVMKLAKIYLYTKFEVSCFTRSKFMEGVPKF